MSFKAATDYIGHLFIISIIIIILQDFLFALLVLI